ESRRSSSHRGLGGDGRAISGHRVAAGHPADRHALRGSRSVGGRNAARVALRSFACGLVERLVRRRRVGLLGFRVARRQDPGRAQQLEQPSGSTSMALLSGARSLHAWQWSRDRAMRGRSTRRRTRRARVDVQGHGRPRAPLLRFLPGQSRRAGARTASRAVSRALSLHHGAGDAVMRTRLDRSTGARCAGDGREMTGLNLPEPLWDLLRQLYGTGPRAYHNWTHVLDMIRWFHEVARDVGWQKPREVFLALLFHDAVYVAGAADNEERSARQAREAIQRWLPDSGIDA